MAGNILQSLDSKYFHTQYIFSSKIFTLNRIMSRRVVFVAHVGHHISLQIDLNRNSECATISI